MVSVLPFIGCNRQERPDTSNAVAQVGDSTISLEQWRAELAAKGNPTDSKERESVLQQMIRTELLFQNAKEKNLESDPEFRRRSRRLLATLYEERFAGAKTNLQPAASAIEAYYQEHSADFAQPERWRVSGILLRIPARATPERRDAVEAGAKALAAQIRSAPDSFTKVAMQHSEDSATRYRRGDLGFLSAPELISRLGTNAASRIQSAPTNTLLDPIVSGDQCWIARVDDHLPSQPKPLAMVSELIKYRLTQAARAKSEADFESRLKQGKPVEILPLGQKELSPPATPPPALPK